MDPWPTPLAPAGCPQTSPSTPSTTSSSCSSNWSRGGRVTQSRSDITMLHLINSPVAAWRVKRTEYSGLGRLLILWRLHISLARELGFVHCGNVVVHIVKHLHCSITKMSRAEPSESMQVLSTFDRTVLMSRMSSQSKRKARNCPSFLNPTPICSKPNVMAFMT